VDVLTDSSSILIECQKPGSSGILCQLQRHDSGDLDVQQQQQQQDQSWGALTGQWQQEEGLGEQAGAQQPHGSVDVLTQHSGDSSSVLDELQKPGSSHCSTLAELEQHDSGEVPGQQQQQDRGRDEFARQQGAQEEGLCVLTDSSLLTVFAEAQHDVSMGALDVLQQYES
jgi:hypothetical protein